MNMTATINQQETSISTASTETVSRVFSTVPKHIDSDTLKLQRQRDAKSLLDTAFPLEKGSHQDVVSYMVYYCNLVACFADGKLTGLKNPSQFVALCGHKDQPDTLLFKNAKGNHVEVSLGRNAGIKQRVTIKDIQLESITHLGSENRDTAIRYWVSLIECNTKGEPVAHLEDKQFTGRSGEDFDLNRFC